MDYGANPLVTSDFDLPAIPIQSLPANGSGNITCNNANLVTQLQNAINAGKARFQIRICFSVPTNGNNSLDVWLYAIRAELPLVKPYLIYINRILIYFAEIWAY